jgi:GDP/UDP-N,N'-diacetylbacillosamine 2-epimerase (hydrolysing)
LIILLGDRFEILSIASICKIYNIPICHLHGGETTKGAIDDKIRHAISKLSSLHFVSHQEHKIKIQKMGEDTNYIFNYGALGLNDINNFDLKKKVIESKLNISFDKKTFIVTFHPETLNKTTNLTIKNLLKALEQFKKINFIFTCPNMDEDHDKVIFQINNFIKRNKNSLFLKSLGKELYFSTLKYINGVIGNSSSGLLEAPSLKIPTINIGDRQKGRLQASSVINCRPERLCIVKAIKKLDSKRFLVGLKKTISPYGKGGSSKKIVKIIKNLKSAGILKKQFFDLNQ